MVIWVILGSLGVMRLLGLILLKGVSYDMPSTMQRSLFTFIFIFTALSNTYSPFLNVATTTITTTMTWQTTRLNDTRKAQ